MAASALALLALSGCATLGSGARMAPVPLPIETVGPSRGSDVRTVVAIVAAGDATAEARGRFARTVADAVADSAAVTILPPTGSAPNDTDLSIERTRAVGSTIAALRQRYPRARIVLFGHSSGAALAADVAGTHRGLIDAMVLASCPCSLPEWRSATGNRDDDGRPDLDPLLTAGGIDPALRAAVLVGAEDRTTPPATARAYAEALALRGIGTDFRVLPGQGHDILGEQETLDAIKRIVGAPGGASSS